LDLLDDPARTFAASSYGRSRGSRLNLEAETGAVHYVLQSQPNELCLAQLKGACEAGGAIGADGFAAALKVGKVRLGDAQKASELRLRHLLALSVREKQAVQGQGPHEFLEEGLGVDALSTHVS
jgi:hypothetical protein